MLQRPWSSRIGTGIDTDGLEIGLEIGIAIGIGASRLLHNRHTGAGRQAMRQICRLMIPPQAHKLQCRLLDKIIMMISLRGGRAAVRGGAR